MSRQHYKACVRKGSGKGYICYGECTSVAGAVESAAADKIADSQVRVSKKSIHRKLLRYF